ncbi:uncharacterized protein PD653_3242 [Nocardioides sp. PD653]|nr:uncharacterized protein PD653B2_1649 [Nocardioides sp. PD653-B2]GAW55816.1 uncharacterized protein PD653_3242 [Nocardioides sp. PD653]
MVAPYDAPMDVDAVVTPPRVSRPLRLLPFRGLSLAATRIGDAASARAFARPYGDVGERFRRLEGRGQVIHDDTPALYLHEYAAGGIIVRGLVGALDISRPAATWEDVAVLPHEGIHPAQADELAHRMAQMELNPAPILLVHRGPARARDLLEQVQTRTPYLDFTDRGRQQHRVWAIRDPAELATLEAALAPCRALIADGHHRFAAYHRLRQDDPGPGTDLGLAMLVDQTDTPLFLGAIHRVLGGVTLDALRETSRAAFDETTAEAAVAALRPDVLAATDGRRWATLRLTLATDQAAVEVLHEELIPLLKRAPRTIGHHHTVEDALAAVARRPGVAVLMPAPDFGLVVRIAAAARLLPEKATSFQPKPSVGVLIRSLRDG